MVIVKHWLLLAFIIIGMMTLIVGDMLLVYIIRGLVIIIVWFTDTLLCDARQPWLYAISGYANGYVMLATRH